MRIATLLASGLMLACLPAEASQHPAYAVGQVWEYRAPPGDEGSLLRIQKIENLPEFAKQGPIYHISIIGLHVPGQPDAKQLQHAPVSRAALDSSVTKLSQSRATFPDPSQGIAEWKAAHGGVFTIPIAEVVKYVEQMLAGPGGDKVAAAAPDPAAKVRRGLIA